MVERYVYTPFGMVTVLDGNWNTLGGSQYEMVYLFQGERYDWTTGNDHDDGARPPADSGNVPRNRPERFGGQR